MPVEHFGVAAESAWGAWATPDTFYRIDSFSKDPGRATIEGRYTGFHRALVQMWPGAKAPSGSLRLAAWGELLGLLLLAAQLPDVTTTQPDEAGNPTVYEHAFLPKDDEPIRSLSAQAQYSGSVGVNILGMVLDKLTISVKAGEAAMIEADWVAKDEAPCDGTWDHDGSSSPALVASPTYVSNTIRPLIFYDASVITGGTVSQDPTTKQLSIAGGTTRTLIESLEITLENNADARPFLQPDPTPGNVVAGNRSITGQFDFDMSTVDPVWYNAMRAGTQMALQLALAGQIISTTYKRALVLTLPLIHITNAPFPDISGSQDRRIQQVQFTAVQDGTVNTDIGVTVRDTQESYS